MKFLAQPQIITSLRDFSQNDHYKLQVHFYKIISNTLCLTSVRYKNPHGIRVIRRAFLTKSKSENHDCKLA